MGEIIFNYLGKQSTNNSSIEFISENVRHPLKSRRVKGMEIAIYPKDTHQFGRDVHASFCQWTLCSFAWLVSNTSGHLVN